MSRNQERHLSPWPFYSEDECAAVAEVLRFGRVNYWTGNECKLFEDEFAGYCQTAKAIAVSNGTVALELALESAGIGPGDEVIVTPRTFIASASCVARVGARPVMADVCLESQNITAESVAAVLSSKTRAIIAVHHAGWPCDMDGLMTLADEHDLVVIEDCAQAHGARYKGRPVGSLGHVGAFSFCQDKVVTTGGEGGMLVTNDEAIWKKAWSIKDHGKSYDAVFNTDHPPGFRWLHESFGTNYRMTEMQAAIGRVQLRKLEEWNARRAENALQLAGILAKYPCIRVPQPPSEIRHAYYRLYGFVEPEQLSEGWDRDRILQTVNDAGVPCFSGSCPEIYNEKAFESNGLRPDEPLPNASALGPRSLAFLVHPTLTLADIRQSCEVLDKIFGEANS